MNENKPDNTVEEKNNNLMLFHGTNKKGATGILKEFFRNSVEEYFGKGLYMTDFTFVALKYCFRAGRNNSKYYMLVNEALESKKLQTFKFNLMGTKDNSFEL